MMRIPASRRGLLSHLALACLTCLVLLPGAGASANPRGHAAAAPPLAGVNVGFDTGAPASTIAREVAVARSLHSTLVRASVPWYVFERSFSGQIEPQRLVALDRFVQVVGAHHMRVILTILGTPCWASSAPLALLHRCEAGRASAANAWPPRNPLDYARFVAYVAHRYGTALAAIEVWNEPDQSNEAYFAGRNKAVRYAAILRAAYTAIKRADPRVQVLGGSLVGSNGAFLRALYGAGIKGFYDGLAVHYYNLTLASLRSIREVQSANGDVAPLWLDEFGWTSCWPRHRTQQEQPCVTTQTQAANLTNTLRALAHVPYVAAAVVYKLKDSAGEEFGLLDAAGRRKAAYAAVARELSSPFGSVARVTVALRRHGSHVTASGSGPVGEFMELEALQGATLRYRAIFVLDRFNNYAINLPAVLGTQGLSVRVYQYGAGPGQAAQGGI